MGADIWYEVCAIPLENALVIVYSTLGDVIYLNVLGQPVLVLESGRATLDLFDKRSNIYSDRPHLVMAGEL